MHKYVRWNSDTFKNSSQLACSVATLLFNVRSIYCTQNPQMKHALPKYIAAKKSILNINYISYVDY